ncbi:putative protein isoform X2 [Capsicum annuum]
MEDRLIELETLQKALQEATEAYDKLQANLVATRKNLIDIFTSKDVKATLLDSVERNQLNRPLLTLLDENITTAHSANHFWYYVLKEYKDDPPFKLGPAKKFLQVMLDILFAFKRVDAMLYISNFDYEVDYLKKSFETLEGVQNEERDEENDEDINLT